MYENDSRNANLPVKFYFFDGRMAFLFLFFILSWSLTMLGIIIGMMVFFKILEWFNLTPEMFGRLIRRKYMSGGKLLCRLSWDKN